MEVIVPGSRTERDLRAEENFIEDLIRARRAMLTFGSTVVVGLLATTVTVPVIVTFLAGAIVAAAVIYADDAWNEEANKKLKETRDLIEQTSELQAEYYKRYDQAMDRTTGQEITTKICDYKRVCRTVTVNDAYGLDSVPQCRGVYTNCKEITTENK